MSGLLGKYKKGHTTPKESTTKQLPSLFEAQTTSEPLPTVRARHVEAVQQGNPKITTPFLKKRAERPPRSCFEGSFFREIGEPVIFNPFMRECYIEFKGDTIL